MWLCADWPWLLPPAQYVDGKLESSALGLGGGKRVTLHTDQALRAAVQWELEWAPHGALTHTQTTESSLSIGDVLRGRGSRSDPAAHARLGKVVLRVACCLLCILLFVIALLAAFEMVDACATLTEE